MRTFPIHAVSHTPGPAHPALAGLTPFSSVDWPGKLVAVLFIGGCPWRCHYCHNPHLQVRHAHYHWPAVCDWLRSRQNLLDGVVFSGGEPLSEPQLPRMIQTVKAMGFSVALHTAGIYPQRLAAVLPQLDWVGFDFKTHAADYDTLTGRLRSYVPVDLSLSHLLASTCPFECRTTWCPTWLSEADLLPLAQQLAARGVQHYTVQRYRPAPGVLPQAQLSATSQAHLARLFPRFEYR